MYNTTYDPNAVADIERFDDNYKPSNMANGLDSLPDADYDFEITGAHLRVTEKSRDAIFCVMVKVSGGARDGQEVEAAWFMKSQKNVDILGSDLVQLGMDADKWTSTNGRRFSQELVKSLPKLPGIRFRAKKFQSANDSDPKKPHHNLRILGRLGSSSAAPPAYTPAAPALNIPVPSASVAVPSAATDEEIPF
jgi:hypothetical protein